MTAPIPALVLTGAEKAFRGRPAVVGVDLVVGGGEVVGLIGENGAGKSTTLRMVMGEVRPDAGEVRIGGSPSPLQRRRVGYVAQDSGLYPDLTGAENLEFLARARDLPPAERPAAFEAALELSGLGEAAHRLLREWSGGMRQRLSLAAAFLGDPILVVLDEAFQGLDPGALLTFRERLLRFAAEGGGAVVCSHNLDLLARVCGRVLLMERGRVSREIEGGDVAALEKCFRKPDAEIRDRS